VDDHAVLRDGVRMVLRSWGRLSRGGHCRQWRRRRAQLADDLRPDIAVLDVAMPTHEWGWAEATRRLLTLLEPASCDFVDDKRGISAQKPAARQRMAAQRAAAKELVSAIKLCARVMP